MKSLFDAEIKSPGLLIKNLNLLYITFLKNKEPLFRRRLFLTKKFFPVDIFPHDRHNAFYDRF